MSAVENLLLEKMVREHLTELSIFTSTNALQKWGSPSFASKHQAVRSEVRGGYNIIRLMGWPHIG